MAHGFHGALGLHVQPVEMEQPLDREVAQTQSMEASTAAEFGLNPQFVKYHHVQVASYLFNL